MNRFLTRSEIGLLALVIMVMGFAHWHWLPVTLIGAFTATVGLRFAWAAAFPGPVPLWLRLLVVMVLLSVLVASVGVPIGREGGSALLICLTALKLLETHQRRDARMLVGVAFFTTMIGFLFSQQMLATVYALAVAVILFAGLRGLTPDHGRAATGLRAAIAASAPLAGRIALAAIPLALVSFMLFPRLSSPLWGAPWDARAGKTGLNDRMQPGSMAGLWNDDTPVFRARFAGDPPPSPYRYWRGPVLWHFDGSTWTGADFFEHERPVSLRAAPSAVIEYEVMMEPTERRWLFPLDLPINSPSGDARVTSDFQILLRRPLVEPKIFTFTSALESRFADDLSPIHRRAALRLPNGSNPRARAFGESLRAEHGADGSAISNAILGLIRQDFEYTLEPPPLMMDRPVDDFLFQTRSGYCEHFSSAYVFVMRAAGIPARVVTGYLGGLYNPNGDYLLIRNSDAHAWAEYWQPGQGWVRVDPTGAVAPERVNEGTVDAALSDAIRWYERGWLGDLGLRADWISAGWRRLVIEYDATRQRDLLRPMGFGNLDSWQLVGILIAAAVVALAAGVWWSTRGRRQQQDPLGVAWQKFVRRLARKGLPIAPSSGPEDIRATAVARWPDREAELDLVIRGYVALRYGHGQAGTLAEVVRALKAFR